MGEPPSNRRFAIRDADDDNCRCRSVVSAGLAAPMLPGAEQHLSLINSRILQSAVVIAEGRADAAVAYMREGLGIGQRSNTAPFI